MFKSGVVVAFTGAACLAASANAQSWTTYQGDTGHTGFVPISTGGFSQIWTRSVTTSSLSQATVGAGKVYLSSAGGVYAVNASSGLIDWNQQYSSAFSVNPPAYANGHVFVQTCNHASDTYLRALNASDGSQFFVAPHSAQWESYLAPTIYNGNAYINGGYYGGMYSINTATGAQNWFTPLAQFDRWTPAVNDQYAITYLGGGGGAPGQLNVLNRASGAMAYTIDDPGYSWNGWSMYESAVLTSTGRVLATNGGRLLGFDLNARTLAWQVSASFQGQVSVAGNQVFVAQGSNVAVRDIANGAPLWSWPIPTGAPVSPMLISNNDLFVSTSTTTYAIDLATHQQVWSYPLGGQMALADGTLYISGANGTLAAISVPAPGPLAIGALALLSTPRRRRAR